MDSIVFADDGIAARAAEIDAFKAEFLRYAAMPDLSVPCPVGKLMRQFDGTSMRQTIWQVVADAMDDKPEFTRRAVELLCLSAQGYYNTGRCSELLSDMAEHWAELRCDL